MWLVTPVGFFSVVRKPGDDDLTVRSRVRADLAALAELLPALGPIEEGMGTDYRYRARVPAAELATVVARMIEDIDYSNFKDEVAARQGLERAHTYGRVWSALHDLSKATR
jgi:hypothetical protein